MADDQAEGAHYAHMVEKIQSTDLDLTDTEWMSIIARERDGLPACCSNISSLRDILIRIARDDGHIDFLSAPALVQRLTWCFPDHDLPSPEIEKIVSQLGWEPFTEHQKDVHEHG